MSAQAEQFEAAIARLPRWILSLAGIGAVLLVSFGSVNLAGGYLFGAIAAYINFRLVERAVNRVIGTAAPGGGRGFGLLIRFAGLVCAAFVILKFSGFSMRAAFWGFLVCPAAVVLEIVYELVTYEHS